MPLLDKLREQYGVGPVHPNSTNWRHYHALVQAPCGFFC